MHRHEHDKIRPKWDWKETEFIPANKAIAEIKSDQNGIESPPVTLSEKG